MDTLEILKSLGIPEDILKMDDFKFKILSALKVPAQINFVDVLIALKDMKIEEQRIGGVTAMQLKFDKNTDQNIIEIIAKAAYSKSGVTQRNLLKFDIVDSKNNPKSVEYDCTLNALSETCESILSQYPNCYMRIKGNLNLRNFIDKKSKFDDSCLRDIIITGDFTCSKYSDFFPYRVDGTFDCSGIGKDYITKDTVFPITPKINCAYSITDFDVLMGILPIGLKTLVVEPKLLKKDFLLNNQEHFTKAFNFIETYPSVTVIDTKGNHLLNIIMEIYHDIDTKKTKEHVQNKEPKPTKTQEIFETKIQGKHLDIKEILIYCRKFSKYNIYTDNELERLIRCVLSNQRKNGIQKKIMRRDDGVNVTCIDASQIDLVRQDFATLTKEREKEEKIETIPTVKQETSKPLSAKRKPINIKKYIKPDQLKMVKKSSGEQNTNSALRAINEINLDPLEMQFQGAVHIMKDGKETVSATVKKESGCCLVQSIDSSNHDDTKRLVWIVADGPDGLILVCVGFREHHNTKKASNMYVNLRSKAYKKQTFTEKDLIKYINIDTLICDNNQNNGNSNNGENIPYSGSDILLQKTAEILQHKR